MKYILIKKSSLYCDSSSKTFLQVHNNRHMDFSAVPWMSCKVVKVGFVFFSWIQCRSLFQTCYMESELRWPHQFLNMVFLKPCAYRLGKLLMTANDSLPTVDQSIMTCAGSCWYLFLQWVLCRHLGYIVHYFHNVYGHLKSFAITVCIFIHTKTRL